ncbi:unnamed protein product [Paramecium sonneborni]|uniref:Protein kinase domain-containing protein n=1 Tax=Paramecium sonneborni TaxID=65129 RepID=A0A8S1RDR4_9CILI|nr:unnamed protein product [Paramecium sonneborni]
MFSFENLTLNNTYEIKISQPKINYIQLFYLDSKQEIEIKLRNANIFYPCKNIKTNQNIFAQQIHLSLSNNDHEIAVLELLCMKPHTNIIHIFEIIKKDNYFFVLQEEITQNLEEFLKTKQNFTVQMKENFFGQLVQGFKYLKSKKIILRDLQPKHIAVKTIRDNEYILQIYDFRSAEISESGRISTLNGMSDFAAPETLKKSQKIQSSCCIYTLGMLLYYICNQGQKPFQANSIKELIQQQEEFLRKTLNVQDNFTDDFKLREYYQQMLIYKAEMRNQSVFELNEQQQEYFLLDNTYFIKKTAQIGNGQLDFIVEAFNIETKEELVCKMIAKNYLQDEISREIQIFKQLEGHQNQNIVQLKKVTEDSDWNFIILEKCSMNIEQLLNAYPNGFTDFQIIDFLQQIITGYCYLKDQNILHRDLKPQNIMIKIDKNNYNIYKIIDFGAGKIITSQDLGNSIVGTPLFTAPEVLEQKQSHNQQCDIFSIGATIFYMIFKRYYTEQINLNDIIKEQQKFDTQPFKCPKSNRNPDIISLIEKMIVYNPQKRINWEQLKNYVVQKNYQDFLNHIYKLFIFALDCEESLFELQEKRKDNLKIVGIIQAYRKIILTLAFKTQQQLEQSMNQGFIKIKEIQYKIDKQFKFQEWLTKNKWDDQKQRMQLNQDKLESEKFHIYGVAQEIINNMNIKENEITLNFMHVHIFYLNLCEVLQNTIFSICDSIKLKFYLVKMKNVFKDFIHYYPLGKGCQYILQVNISEEYMKEYLIQNL